MNNNMSLLIISLFNSGCLSRKDCKIDTADTDCNDCRISVVIPVL